MASLEEGDTVDEHQVFTFQNFKETKVFHFFSSFSFSANQHVL